MGVLLARAPQIVLARYLVNTSFDSDALDLSEEARAKGWRSDGPLTYSPKIDSVASVPHRQFDEWLAFVNPPGSIPWESVINFCGLSLIDRSYDWVHARLWTQIERFQPESYFAEGDRLIFITRSQALSDAALAQGPLDGTRPR